MSALWNAVVGLMFIVIAPIWTPFKLLVKIGQYAKHESKYVE